MNRLNFALDYDSTYTSDPELFDRFIADIRERGHRVFVVTARRDTPENRAEVVVPGVLIYFTGLAAKAWYMEHRGVPVDIWIDDDPRVIIEGM